MVSASEAWKNIRAIYLVALCCIGSFLFSYDTGIVGGVLTLAAFQRDFGYTTAQATNINSNCVSILQAGAFFGCFMVWPVTQRFGRRWTIVLCSFVFCIGGILQVINTHSIGAFYAGRVISGLGVGAATVLVPMFSAEMAPKHMRGQLGAFFQLFFALGVMTSYWVNYGVTNHVASSTMQWQIPIGLQMVPGGLLGFGMLFVKESVRWLAKKGRHDQALANLIWVRKEDSEAVHAEFAEIIAGIEQEERDTDGLTWRELLLPVNRFRIFVVVTMQLGVQMTGNTSLAYYAPQIFTSLGAGSKATLFTGFFGVVKVVAVSIFCLFVVGRVGRKAAFMGGAIAMGTCMLVVAILGAVQATKHTSGAAASIAFIYLESMSYQFSWGALSWVYLGEIFPNRTREVGIAIGAAAQWLFNFAFSQITPHAVNNIGWRTFLMFAIFNYFLVVYTYFVIRETSGKSLEEMDQVFGANAKLEGQDSAKDVEADRSNDKAEIVELEGQRSTV